MMLTQSKRSRREEDDLLPVTSRKLLGRATSIETFIFGKFSCAYGCEEHKTPKYFDALLSLKAVCSPSFA